MAVTEQGRGQRGAAAAAAASFGAPSYRQQHQRAGQDAHRHSHAHSHADDDDDEDEDDDDGDSSDDNSGGNNNQRKSSSSGPHEAAPSGNVSTRPPPKKRNRAALSCTLCRERKVKCDRVIPCYQCIKRGDAKFCQLDPTKRGPKSSRSQAARNQNAALAAAAAAATGTKSASTSNSASAVDEHTRRYGGNGGFGVSSADDEGNRTRRGMTASSSYGSSTEEVDAIKARLAQLEAALAQAKQGNDMGPGGMPPYNGSSSSSIANEPSPGSSLGRFPWQQQQQMQQQMQAMTTAASGATTDDNRFVASPSNRSSSAASSSYASAYIHPYLQQQPYPPSASSDGGSGRLGPASSGASPVDGMAMSPYDMRLSATARRTSNDTRGRSTDDALSSPAALHAASPRHQRFVGSQAPQTPSSKMDVDSDTEDAALVLEGLAMGGGGGGSGAAKLARRGDDGACDGGSTNGAGAGADGVGSGSGKGGRGQGGGDEAGQRRRSTVVDKPCPSAEGDVIEKTPAKSIQGFVDADRTKDIMQSSRYDGPDRDDDDGGAGGCSKGGAMGSKAKPLATNRDSASMETDDDGGAGSGRKKGEEDGGGGACPGGGDDDEAEFDVNAEFDKDGKRLSPAKRVCRLLSKQDNSLFTLYAGPDTSFGFGIGWAFAAAEAAGDVNAVSKVQGCRGARQREAVLRAIIRSLPDEDVANHLVGVFETRVKFLAGNCIHMATFKRELQAFYHLDTIEKRARVVNLVDTAWLSLFLMILVLALHFHPCQRPDNVVHLFDGRTIHLWRSAAQTGLVLARYQTSSSMAVLQTIILIGLHACGTGFDSANLLPVAIANAIDMGLHRLGSRDKQPKPGEKADIAMRREVAKRIWHQLVFCDACSAATRGGANFVHPDQFNTPLPGNYNDDDLNQSPLPPPRPRSEHTEMSFALAQFDLAGAVRENVDRLNRALLVDGTARLTAEDTSYLDARYRGLLENAPSFFRIGSEEGSGENVEVERWLLQQSVFHKLLKLHRPNLTSKPNARTSCVLLARSILDMQRRIRSRCSVVDRLFFNLSQSFSAAIVLCLDLLQTRPPATMRSIVRGEIFEALKALRHVGASHHTTESSIRVIQALLDEEEARWNQTADYLDDDANGASSSSMKRKRNGQPHSNNTKKNLLNLALRVAKAARCEGRMDDAKDESVPSSSPSLSSTSAPAISSSSSAAAAAFAAPTAAAAVAAGGGGTGALPAMTTPDRIRAEEAAAAGAGLVPSSESGLAMLQSYSSMKDEESRRLFDQLLLPQPAGDDPSSFANMPNLQQYNFFGGMAPNGLDLLGLQATPPDSAGQEFDLSKFLAECDTKSSPGSSDDQSMASGASHSGHSSLHGGGSGVHSGPGSVSSAAPSLAGSSSHHHHHQRSPNASFSSGSSSSPMAPPQTQAQTAAVSASNPSPAASTSSSSDISTSGLDGFWSWVLGQGGIQQGGGQQVAPPPAPPSQSQHQQQHQQQQIPTTSGIDYFPPPSSSENAIAAALNAPPQRQAPFPAAAPSSSGAWASSGAQAFPAAAPSPSSFPFAGFPTSTSANAAPGQQQQAAAAGAGAGEAISMGTPSAGMGLGWMSTPGLFELAYEFGDGSGPGSGSAPQSAQAK
ncbi:hypothetical protein FA10DRAFT_279047 [Acaromyces ingoldii]|uniref:Zn(2)-C6 fungal-type domain-containing protein n=1 Tax=Acaromyces ingoldii TaxID=215250 RepID=A0A316YSK8_9BASI|nr:hypothetical protein FA10DRAFT_279047 [Acaromyces ingoldii]PWN92540.1 hypothetical protein FA10DRAFT_279047 [Acaromyces ingoldii]